MGMSLCCIILEMYRAEVQPMPTNPLDRVPRTGLWKVVIYEGNRFVRTDKEYLIISVAERFAAELNYQFSGKRRAKERDGERGPHG
jgi:hypothetical protein